MKMWKKFAAALLIAAMALTMLTACGGTGVVRDTKTEKNIVGWAQELADDKGITIENDEKLNNAAVAALTDYVKYRELVAAGDKDAANTTYNNMVANVNTAVGKTCWVGTLTCTNREVDKGVITDYTNNSANRIYEKLGAEPKAFGVGVAKKGNVTYVILVATN